VASARIGEEIAKVPKMAGGDRKSNIPRVEHLKSGREDIGISRASRELGVVFNIGGRYFPPIMSAVVTKYFSLISLPPNP
jgi:hypothetical protein